MSVVRAFIALDLSPEISWELEKVASELQQRLEGVPVRWVPVKNIHLTLKFLGDVSEANLEILKKILQNVAGGCPAFEFKVGGLGAFPSATRARVIWVGVEAPGELNSLQRRVDDETARLGYAREDRPYSPHLTLGRVSRNATSQDARKIGIVLNELKVGQLGTARSQSVYLYRSDLQPSGAVYSRLSAAALEGS